MAGIVFWLKQRAEEAAKREREAQEVRRERDALKEERDALKARLDATEREVARTVRERVQERREGRGRSADMNWAEGAADRELRRRFALRLIITVTGLLLLVSGVGLALLGYAGAIELELSIGEFSGKLANATPGIVLVFLGAVLIAVAAVAFKVVVPTKHGTFISHMGD